MSGNSTSLKNSIQIWAEHGWQRPRGTGHDSPGCLCTEHSRDRATPRGTGSGFQVVRPTSRECSAARYTHAMKLWPCIFYIIFIDTSLLKGGRSILYGLGRPSASLLPVLWAVPIFPRPCLERKEPQAVLRSGEGRRVRSQGQVRRSWSGIQSVEGHFLMQTLGSECVLHPQEFCIIKIIKSNVPCLETETIPTRIYALNVINLHVWDISSQACLLWLIIKAWFNGSAQL